MHSIRVRALLTLSAVAAGAVLATGCGTSEQAAPEKPGHELVTTLDALLPDGATSRRPPPARAANSGPVGRAPSASAIVRRNGAEGRVDIVARRLPTPVAPEDVSCPDSALHPYSRCTEVNLRGVRRTTDTSPLDASSPSAARRLTTVLTHPDGRQLTISEANTRPRATTSRPSTPPPLPMSLREIADMAGSAAWEPVLTALPTPAPARRTGPDMDQSTPARRITRLIVRALPPAVRVGDEGGQPGYGHLTVDDGRGRCLIAVTVQRWKPGDRTIGAVFDKAGAGKRADGTRVMTGTGPAANGGDGAVEWRADTLRPDGLRVLVTEINARAFTLRGTRPTPALDLAQLTGIALNGGWNEVAGARAAGTGEGAAR